MDNTQLSLVVANIAVSCGVHYMGTFNVLVVRWQTRWGSSPYIVAMAANQNLMA